MIEKSLIPVGGLKKEPFSGSHHGMRYLLRSDESKETFSVFIYPEPWSFEKTPKEHIRSASFSMTEDGMDQAIAWLFSQYDSRKDFWNRSAKEAMHIVNSAKQPPLV